MGDNARDGQITEKLLKRFYDNTVSDPVNKLAMNAVTRGKLQELALNRDVLNNTQFLFSHEVETTSEITDQKKSGTCWMFAELNWLRIFTQKEFKIKQFEFSQNYILFWDKLEKANYFLEAIISLRDADIDDRRLRFLLDNPTTDGGEWHMLVNLIKRYGVIPKEVMPDTSNRENTRFVNEILSFKLREFAAIIRKLHHQGKTLEHIRRKKQKMLEEIYRILVICFGFPPRQFTWSYRDTDKKFHRETNITPQQFAKKYILFDLDKIYTLMSCPSERTEFYKTYNIEFFNNTFGGLDWLWLNVPIRELKKIAVKMLKNGDPCLYGCDVVLDSHTKEGLMYSDLYEYDLIFQTSFKMSKANRVDYGHTHLTHSMVLTGVDIVNNKPVKWKVENSWGTDVGKKGFFIMSDEWFEHHTFDLIVPEKYLPEKLLNLFDQKPEILPPWFPMA